MENNKSMEVCAKAPIRKAVLQNALPAMAAMLMVLIYNLADTFFIGQTHDDLQVNLKIISNIQLFQSTSDDS